MLKRRFHSEDEPPAIWTNETILKMSILRFVVSAAEWDDGLLSTKFVLNTPRGSAYARQN